MEEQVALLGGDGQSVALQERIHDGGIHARIRHGRVASLLHQTVHVVEAVLLAHLQDVLLHGRVQVALVRSGIGTVLVRAVEHMLVVAGAILGRLELPTEDGRVLKVGDAVSSLGLHIVALGAGIGRIAVSRQTSIVLNDGGVPVRTLSHAAGDELVAPQRAVLQELVIPQGGRVTYSRWHHAVAAPITQAGILRSGDQVHVILGSSDPLIVHVIVAHLHVVIHAIEQIRQQCIGQNILGAVRLPLATAREEQERSKQQGNT